MTTPQLVQADLRSRTLQRADMVNSDFVTTAELDFLLDATFRELYGMMTSQYEGLFVATADLTTANGTESYTLPAAFKKLKLLQHYNNSQYEYALRRADWRDIEVLNTSNNRKKPTHYILFNDPVTSQAMRVMLLPTPDAVYTVRLRYVPNLALSDVVGTASSNLIAGWDGYMILGTTIKLKDKEESDTYVLFKEMERLTDRLLRDLRPIDESEPAQIQVFGGQPNAIRNMDPFDVEDLYGGL